MTDKKYRRIRQLGSAYYHFCKESTKESTPIYELQHQFILIVTIICIRLPWVRQ